jgi:hypothetical protein
VLHRAVCVGGFTTGKTPDLFSKLKVQGCTYCRERKPRQKGTMVKRKWTAHRSKCCRSLAGVHPGWVCERYCYQRAAANACRRPTDGVSHTMLLIRCAFGKHETGSNASDLTVRMCGGHAGERTSSCLCCCHARVTAHKAAEAAAGKPGVAPQQFIGS